MKKIAYFLSLAILSTQLYSCGGESTETPNEATNSESDFMEETEDDEDAPEFFLPSALQIGSVFQRSGLKYVEGIVNNPVNVNNYVTKTEKLLNFGSYSANLSYCVLNNQSQQAMSLLKAVKQLSEDIGLSEIFSSADLIRSFEANLGNQDSIIDIIIKIQERTDNYIDENGLKSIATTIFAGAWIEGMYMGVKATSGEDRERITGRLVEQMTICDNLIKALTYYNKNNDEMIESLIANLTEMRNYYNDIDVIKNNDGQSIRDLKINYSDIKQIADMIIETRKMITKTAV